MLELQESSRAQKRRQKVAAQGVERESRIAAELAEAGDSERQLEEGALRELLLPLGYAVRDIQARFWYFTNAIAVYVARLCLSRQCCTGCAVFKL